MALYNYVLPVARIQSHAQDCVYVNLALAKNDGGLTAGPGGLITYTLSYTNQAGTSGRTATIASFPATAVAGTFVPFQLAAGDTGVRSIQSITLGTSYGGGAIHLVAYRILARLELPIANTGGAIDAVSGGFVRCFDNTVPFLVWLPTSTTGVTVAGQLIITQG